MHLRQTGFTYSACGPIQMILIKLVFNMIWLRKYKDLEKRTQSNEFLKYKAFAVASNPKYDRYEGEPVWCINFSIKKQKGPGIKNEIKENQQFAK